MNKNDIVNRCLKSKRIKDKFAAVEFVCEVLKITRTDFIFKDDFSEEETNTILGTLKEYEKGKPIAKITNNANFYGIDFFVNCDVLTPRQDSELIVFLADKIIKANQKAKIKVLDLCTGSGCLGITIKYLNPDVDLTLADISEKALQVASQNSARLDIDCDIVLSDLFDGIKGCYDIIVTNPPYIKSCDIDNLESEVKNYDPVIALDGKEDGLEFYKKISDEVLTHLKENGILICEFGFDQAEDIKRIFKDKFREVKIYKDNGGNNRVAVCIN